MKQYFKDGIVTEDGNQVYLQDKCIEGLCKRGITPDNVVEWKKYTDRLRYELGIIESGHLASFFLNTAYICLKMKASGILVGLGRGSAAGSLVCYCLKITEIDPIKYGLLFERFLNPTRIQSISSADIDIDIPRDKRQSVLKMVKDDFGHDRTFQVINKLTWTKKTAIKDLAKIIGVPFNRANKITKIIGDEEDIESIHSVKLFLDEFPFIRDNYEKLVGLTKTYSIHAGGVIILDKPVEYYDSIVKVNGVECLDNNGKTCDSLGFLKQDLLGINTLTIISDCLDLLSDVQIPTEYNDPAVYDTINKSTLGVFQIEAAGATDVCKRLKPQNFDELCAVVALCRPGAMDSGDTDHYINRKHGIEPIRYDHVRLEPILRDNYGAIIYQEDVMHIVTEFAGMTPVDADNIRRGIGKKIQAVFDEYHPKFIQACISQNIDSSTAQIVWDKMEASASYSFNKSHCVSYTALSYICAWLKTYYPIEFYLAILNNTDDEDKRIKVYNEIKNINQEIMNPDINMSKSVTSAGIDGKVYLSFNLIKGVGPSAIENILSNQPYSSFHDFDKRTNVNITVKKALIESGAFDRFNQDRCELYNSITQEENEWDEKETLFREFQRIKINPRGNVLDLYDLNEFNIDLLISTLKKLKQNNEDYNDFYVKALISEYKTKDDYAYLSITDGFDALSIFVGKEFIPRYIDTLNEVGTPLLLHLHGKGDKYSLLSCINLLDVNKYKHEYEFYNGECIKKLQLLQKDNPNIGIGVAHNITYFTSKKGNNCVRFNLLVGYEDKPIVIEGLLNCMRPVLMVDGSYVFFTMGSNPTFPEIYEVH